MARKTFRKVIVTPELIEEINPKKQKVSKKIFKREKYQMFR